MVLDSEVKAAIFKAAETFKRMGAIVEEFDLGLCNMQFRHTIS